MQCIPMLIPLFKSYLSTTGGGKLSLINKSQWMWFLCARCVDQTVGSSAGCLLYFPCYYSGISSIPVLFDDRPLPGENVTEGHQCFFLCVFFFFSRQTGMGTGRNNVVSLRKLCRDTKLSTFVDKTQPSSLGEVSLSFKQKPRAGAGSGVLPRAS